MGRSLVGRLSKGLGKIRKRRGIEQDHEDIKIAAKVVHWTGPAAWKNQIEQGKSPGCRELTLI